MDLEFDGIPARGLRLYVDRVREALGLAGDSSYVQAEPPLHAYLALDGHLPAFPDSDVALVWEEDTGWAIAAEINVGQTLLVQAYLDGDLVPEPSVVAWFVQRMLLGEDVGSVEIPRPRGVADAADVSRRLAGYATPASNTRLDGELRLW